MRTHTLQDCVVLWRDEDYRWADKPCIYTYNYICAYGPAVQTTTSATASTSTALQTATTNHRLYKRPPTMSRLRTVNLRRTPAVATTAAKADEAAIEAVHSYQDSTSRATVEASWSNETSQQVGHERWPLHAEFA